MAQIIEAIQRKGIEDQGDISKIMLPIHLPIAMLSDTLMIYNAYAPFLIDKGNYLGPTDPNLKLLKNSVHEDRGVQVFVRMGNVTITEATQDALLAANDYVWPNGAMIRDYLVVLTNAIDFWGYTRADKNKDLLRQFQIVFATLRICEVPQFETVSHVCKWLNDHENPMMIALPRYGDFADLNVPSDAARLAFQTLDEQVVKHCSQERIFKKRNNVDGLIKSVKRKNDDGLGIFGYFYRSSPGENAQPLMPGPLFQHRYALIRVTPKDYENSLLEQTLIRLAQLFIISNIFMTWGSDTGMRTIQKLKESAHKGSIMAMKNPNIVNEALDSLRSNPRDPVPKCIIQGIVYYGIMRMSIETKAEIEARPKPVPKQGVDPPRQPTGEELLTEKLKESRLRVSDKDSSDDSMMLPIVLIAAALFLVMR